MSPRVKNKSQQDEKSNLVTECVCVCVCVKALNCPLKQTVEPAVGEKKKFSQVKHNHPKTLLHSLISGCFFFYSCLRLLTDFNLSSWKA